MKDGDIFSVEVSPSKVNRTASLWPETNYQEVVSYMKVYRGNGGTNNNVTDIPAIEASLDANRTQIGAVEIDFSDALLIDKLPTYGRNDMSQLHVTASNTLPQGDASEKVPFLIASLRLKTEMDSETIHGSPSSSAWLHNGITNPYATTGITDSNGNAVDQDEGDRTHQYELTWEPMTSWKCRFSNAASLL